MRESVACVRAPFDADDRLRPDREMHAFVASIAAQWLTIQCHSLA